MQTIKRFSIQYSVTLKQSKKSLPNTVAPNYKLQDLSLDSYLNSKLQIQVSLRIFSTTSLVTSTNKSIQDMKVKSFML